MCTSSTDLLSNTLHRPSNYWLSYLSAGHPETPLCILSDLAHSAEHTIRVRVAENRLTPVLVQRILVSDPHPEVRSALADNPSVSEEILWKLAQDEDPIVRYELADNPKLSLPLLISLVNDSNPYVAVRAEQTVEKILNASQKVSRNSTEFVQLSAQDLQSTSSKHEHANIAA